MLNRAKNAACSCPRGRAREIRVDSTAMLPAGFGSLPHSPLVEIDFLPDLAGPRCSFPACRGREISPAIVTPFRAESHFLYFLGRAVEGAALLLEPGKATLFAPPPDPEAELWAGRQPGLEELSRELAIEVRPINELKVPEFLASLPAQDAESANWQSELLGRDVIHGSGFELEGLDRELGEAVIEIRLEHDAAAIAQLRFARARRRARAPRGGMRATRPGMREFAVRAPMEAAIIGSGCVCSYNSIVTAHGEVLHNERHDGPGSRTTICCSPTWARRRPKVGRRT